MGLQQLRLLMAVAVFGLQFGCVLPANNMTRLPVVDRQYLIPFMMFGPNNQLFAIRETLALSRVLGRTLVLPDLQAHNFTDLNEEPMAFKDLFDLGHLKSHSDAVLLEDLPGLLGGGGGTPGAEAWNRSLDAVLLMVLPKELRLTRDLISYLQLAAPPRDRWLPSPVTSWHGCGGDRLDQLRTLLAPFRVVGVQTFHGLLYGSHWLSGPILLPCSDACCAAYKETLPLLRKSAAVYSLADGFIQRRLGGQPFLAAHLRPYPDGCVKLWNQPDTPDRAAKMENSCNNAYLLDRFVPSIKHLMTQYGVTRLFLMTHPRVRNVSREMLKGAGIEPVFMDLEDIQSESGGGAPPGLSTRVSFSLLAMLEEAVCIRATAFVGTRESSMTGSIIQERIGHGLPVQDSYAFFRRTGYERRPVAVQEFYHLVNMSVTGTATWRQRLRDNGVLLAPG